MLSTFFRNSGGVWRPNFIYRFIKRRPVYLSLSAILVLTVFVGSWSLATNVSQRQQAGGSGSSQLELGGALAIPVDENNRPPLKVGDSVDLIATSSDLEPASYAVAKGAQVFNVGARSVSVIVAPADVPAVVSALVTSTITIIRIS